MAGGTGNGTTLAWSNLTNALTAEVMEVGSFDPNVPAIDKTLLSATNYQQFIAGKLMEHGPIPITLVWDATKCVEIYNGDHGTRSIGDTGTLVISFGITNEGNTSKATLTGTGFFTSFPTPVLGSNQLMQTTAMWQFDGGTTKPVFVDEAA